MKFWDAQCFFWYNWDGSWKARHLSANRVKNCYHSSSTTSVVNKRSWSGWLYLKSLSVRERLKNFAILKISKKKKALKVEYCEDAASGTRWKPS